MEYLTIQNLTNPQLQQFMGNILERINFKSSQDKTGTRTKVLLTLYLANLEKRGIGLREVRKYIDKDLSTIWRHIAQFEEAGIAIQAKRGKWQLTSRTLTAALAYALNRCINEFNIALAYARAIDDQFGLTIRENLPIWVKIWITPLPFMQISDEGNSITSQNQALLSKTTPIKARPTKEKVNDEEKRSFGCIAGLYFGALFGKRAVFLVSYFLYDCSFVPFS